MKREGNSGSRDYAEVGRVFMNTGRLAAATSALNRAHRIDPDYPKLKQWRRETYALGQSAARAEDPEEVPSIQVSDRERARGRLATAKLELAAAIFRRYGV